MNASRGTVTKYERNKLIITQYKQIQKYHHAIQGMLLSRQCLSFRLYAVKTWDPHTIFLLG